jgi:hypothetical protein
MGQKMSANAVLDSVETCTDSWTVGARTIEWPLTPPHVQPTVVRDAEPAESRRLHPRVHGPFDGVRIGALETPVQLYDLSRGGCFINSMHQQQPGVRLLLQIDLPHDGWITVRAETLPRSNEFGYAVRFVNLSAEAAERLERALQALQEGVVPAQ